jgi:signal transduction histidine kinase/ActR/RegA family two-component response regulator
MWAVIALGAAVTLCSALRLPVGQLDLRCLLLALITIGISSRLTIKIPRIQGQITVSDTFIFLTLLLYGGETAVLLAVVEACCSSRRFGRKLITFLYNAAVMAGSTFLTAWTLRLCFGRVVALPRGEDSVTFPLAIGLMALVQYLANTSLIAVAAACRADQPVWPVWRRHFSWASITYFAGASASGIIATLVGAVGFYAVLATTPIIAVIYFTYQTYLRNIEASLQQAEQAERHLAELSHYLAGRQRAEQERDQLLLREQEARREAETANRTKDEFLAMVSHELRTPLTAILGWSRLLADNQLEATQHAQAVEAIDRNARVQVQLINDLLDVSRIITGKLHIEARPIKLQAVIAAAIDSVRPAANAKAVRLETAPDPALAIVAGDPDRLQQVVWNLLSNAIKFTPSGGRVTIRLATVASQVRLTVSDTGRGIKPEFLPHMFDRFRQAESTSTRTQGGLGLGLTIVRYLVELHGGTVQAESPGEGRGTVMQVNLPLLACQSEPAPTGEAGREPSLAHHQAAALSGVRVLVVDDDDNVLELLTTVLEGRGASVTKAASAAEAMLALKDVRPHVLVSDISMPVTNGYELMRAVRSLSATDGGGIPAVAVTAFARAEDRAQALAAGFQEHLPKPVLPEELVRVVARLAGRRLTHNAAAAHSHHRR